MQNYTDDQLKLAILDASDQRNIFIRTAYSLEDIDSSAIRSLRTLLYHLPDQPDEWERCEFSDIRKGDRVRAEFIDITYEGIAVDVRDYEIAIGHNRNAILRAWKNPDLYRIPAPVQHPDPAEHPVIIIRGGDIYDGIPMPQDAIWTGTSYESRTHSFQPGDITDWTPAKVVADDE